MKKVLMLGIPFLIFLALGVKAQFIVGGNLGINSSGSKTIHTSTTYDDSKGFSFQFNPRAGYFMTKKLALGMGLGIGTSRYTTYTNGTNETINKNNTWEVAPFARFYFKKIGNFSFFGEGILSIGQEKLIIEYPDGSPDAENKVLKISERILPGFSYSLTDKIELEVFIGSIASTTTIRKLPEAETDEDYKRISTGFGLNFGLENLYFGIIVKL
jgi:outer membrane protein